MKTEYEQMEIDTRNDLEKALADLTVESVDDALTLIQKNCDTSNDNLMPQTIRNRYEAYGVAAEQTAGIDAAVKTIRKDVQGLLDTLPDPNRSAVEATGSIFNSIVAAAGKLIQAAAIMKRTMNHLYTVEADRPTPLDDWAASEQDYQEAEPLNAGESDNEED